MSSPARHGLLGVLGLLLAAGGFVGGRASVEYWPTRAPGPRVAASPTPAAPSPSATLPPVLAAVEASQAPAQVPPPVAVPAAAPASPSGPPPAAVASAPPPLASPAPVAVEAPPRRRAARAPASPPARAEPTPAPPPPSPAAPPPPAPRRFVQGQTVIENMKRAGGGLQGFETSGVGVRRAPEVVGHLDLEMTPEEVRPGESYAVRIFLANEGRKTIQLSSMNVAVVADGKRNARAMIPRVREIAPRERVLLAELPGVWREALAKWDVEVNATPSRQASYRNDLRLQ